MDDIGLVVQISFIIVTVTKSVIPRDTVISHDKINTLTN